MEWPSALLKFLIIVLFFANVTSVNYVKPFERKESEKASPCSKVQRPCLTLNEYARGSDEYFVNNTRFYFYPGIHRLDYSVNLVNLHNFSFLGWPNSDQVVTIAVDSSASITWNESWNIEISSITFALHGIFTFIMRFERSQSVQLSNISIYGNWYSGCSSIVGEESALEFNNSKFIGINGYVGAALMIYASNITFRGSTMFADNAAVSGGSIYLTHNSTLTLNGTSLFRNSTSKKFQMLSCSNVNVMKEIEITSGRYGSYRSGGAIVCNNSYLDIHYSSSFTHNIAGRRGGAMMLYTCSLNIQSNASFVGNEAALFRGGAMLLLNTDSNINGNLLLKKNKAFWGGAVAIIEGNFIIKGHTVFDSNSAENRGGALHIGSHVNFIFCGSVYSGSNSTSFDTDALPLNNAAEYSTDNALSFNNSIVFLRNTAEYQGGSIACGNESTNIIVSTVTFIGIMYFIESYQSAINGYGCNMRFIGTTYFYENSALYEGGGAIVSSNSNIMLSGTAYFEGNIAANKGGGAIALANSKLIFKPNLNVFFILNYAIEKGGALYIEDSRCSLGSSAPIECFMTIDGPSTSTSNILLYFISNSAGITGSILYGGQLDRCRLYFKSTDTNQSDLCDCQVTQVHSYSDNALEIFLNMSDITLNEDHVPIISSTSKEIKICGDNTQELSLYPGQKFTIPLKALGQANSTVQGTVYWGRNPQQTGDYRLSPSFRELNDSCTDVSFRLYTSEPGAHIPFKLYPEILCQNLFEAFTLSIYVLPCPVGFNLSRGDSKCVCAMALKKLSIQNCYIDSKSQSVERIRNNFWIGKLDKETLILHKFPCPLDYCTTI